MSSRRTEPPRKIAEDDLPQIAALARAEKEAEWAQRAIREHQAIVGMNYREVELAKGTPVSKGRAESLTEAERAKGAVEKWIFRSATGETGAVLFGASGLVVYSSDVGDKPRTGQVIRR